MSLCDERVTFSKTTEFLTDSSVLSTRKMCASTGIRTGDTSFWYYLVLFKVTSMAAAESSS